MKPRIGVTVSKRTGWRVFPLMAFNIWLAGGKAVKWLSSTDVDFEQVDGVIIGGGDDISPDLYGGSLHLQSRVDPERDAFELSTLKQAFARNIPILGICRGAQMLNISLGGSLDQDAYSTYNSRHYKTVLPRKTVCVVTDTRLAELCGERDMKVNALHSQAIDRLGTNLVVSARDDGGMIQAVERTTDPFAIGTQWHPEHLFFARRQRRLFQGIVAAAIAYRCGGNQTRAVQLDAENPA